MHEMSLIQSLLEQLEVIAKQNKLTRITKVVLQLGDFRQCVPEILEFAFTTLTEGTKAEGAKLVLEHLPIKMECLSCGEIFTVERHVYFCPQCQETQLKLLSGKEFILSSIDGE